MFPALPLHSNKWNMYKLVLSILQFTFPLSLQPLCTLPIPSDFQHLFLFILMSLSFPNPSLYDIPHIQQPILGLLSLLPLPFPLHLIHHLPVLISHAALLLLALDRWFLLTQIVTLTPLELTTITLADVVTSANPQNAWMPFIPSNVLNWQWFLKPNHVEQIGSLTFVRQELSTILTYITRLTRHLAFELQHTCKKIENNTSEFGSLVSKMYFFLKLSVSMKMGHKTKA